MLGVLEISHDSEWGSPSFAQPKPKTNRVSFLSYFRNINKQLNRKPYPITKINEILLKLKGFQYATSLYLKIGYYNIRLINNTSNFCTIILPLVKCCHKRITMGLATRQKFSNRK